jgi:glycosyltransferase involved in cell wall biosynthesis
MKTRVCHLSSVHFALDTRIFYRFCRSLAADYEVTLIAVHPKEELKDGVHILPFHRFKNKLLRVSFTWFIMFIKAIRVNAQIYQLHDPELIPCGLLLRLFGKKVILDIHENVAEDIFDKPWIRNKRLLYSFFAFFEKMAVRYFVLFLAENSYEKRYQTLGARYQVILNYYDPEFFQPFAKNVNRQTHRIFYVGIILESRGLLQIAEAMYILKQKGITVEFDIVGELYADLANKLMKLPFWNEVDEHMHFHGRLSLEQGYAFSRNASVGMCIIHPMSNSVGSYPTKMFEYMAIGLPQVISNFPLYRSVVETHNCGICVDPMQPDQIANAIEVLLTNTVLAEQMGQNGLAAASNYSWPSEAEKVKEVYKTILV